MQKYGKTKGRFFCLSLLLRSLQNMRSKTYEGYKIKIIKNERKVRTFFLVSKLIGFIE